MATDTITTITLTPEEIAFLKSVLASLTVNPTNPEAPAIVALVQSIATKLSE